MAETESAADPFHLCGTTIEGKYRVASVVGDGGFGVVYRGVHKGFGELIAIKCLKLPTQIDEKQRESLLEQLREEGRLLHRLSKATSGIVQALDVGAFTTPAGLWVPYLVLEWLEGETLAEHLKKRAQAGEGGYPLAEAIRLLDPAARALAVAHQQKVAHRDVKPPNLFVTESAGQRTVKVLDFGIAKILTDHPSFTKALEATKAGPAAFTPRYGAPEQFNKQRGASGPWTDVFALALIVVEVITGRKALDGDDPTELYISAADPTTRPTARTRGADVPDAVEQVLEKALDVEPKRRYPSAGEFWDALLAAADLGPVDRVSRPSAPKIAAATTAGGITTGSALLATPDFAAKVKLDVSSAPAAPRELPMLATMPAESMAAIAQPPVVVKQGPPASLTAKEQGGVKVRLPTSDPMAETPPSAPSPNGSSATPVAAPSRKSTPAPVASASRPIWPWVLGAIVIGGGAGYAVLRGDDAPTRSTAKPSPSASSARPKVSPSAPVVSPSGSHGPTAAPSASAAVTASAAPDVAPAPQAAPEDMVLLPAGSFSMGEGSDARQVTLSRSFYLDRTEVTARAYQACVAKRLCAAADYVSVIPEGPIGDASDNREAHAFSEAWTGHCNARRGALDHPINCVDFTGAEAYCKWRGRRLPTDAEWEYAARGAEGRAFPWGSEAPECGRACFDRNGHCVDRSVGANSCAAGVHPADRTPEGVYDLGGSVSEWVSDGFIAHPLGGVDPHGDTAAPLRVLRGGSFLDTEEKLKATWRTGVAPVTAHVTIGFRCAMDGPAPPSGDGGAP